MSIFTFQVTDETDQPFYTGVGSSDDVPGDFHVAINGHGYMLDTSHSAFTAGITTIPLIRQQADNSTEPGEATANPEDLWSRSQHSWHKGAGQLYLDDADSDRARFRDSLHVDCWTRGQLRNLNTTSRVRTSANTNLSVLRVGDYLYVADGNDVRFALSPYSSFTDAVIFNGEAAQSVKSITSDGYNVWAALGSNGVHATTRAAVTSTHYSDLSATLISYVKGRLMAANGAAIYNIVASGAAPTALMTQANSDFKWVGFAEGLTCLYAAGYSGDKSLIYRTAVKADGTALDAPVIAGELPDGEVIASIQGYLGFVLVGTTQGVRVGTPDAQGNITFGPLIDIGATVRSFEPQGQYVWFGWENNNLDTTTLNTGLGRIDLTIFNDSGAPAYASDLMSSGFNGSVPSIATDVNDHRFYAVNGAGFFVETSTAHASGLLYSGKAGFGLAVPKIALRFNVNHQPLPTSSDISVNVRADDGAWIFVGTSSDVGSTSSASPMRVPEVAARYFETAINIVNAAVLERYELQSYPTGIRGREITVPILLHDVVRTVSGRDETVDVRAEYEFITAFEGASTLVSYQELSQSFSTFITQTKYERHHPTTDNSWWNGTLIVTFKELGD